MVTLWSVTGALMLRQAFFFPRQFAMLFAPVSAPGKALLILVLAINVGTAMAGLSRVEIAGTPVTVLGSVPLAAFVWARFFYLGVVRPPAATMISNVRGRGL
jgi:hypothetical protein